MAIIDVSELMADLDFIDPVVLRTATTTVDTYGVNQLSYVNSDAYASVQPADYKELRRLPEEIMMSDVRKFYLKTDLILNGTTAYPDIIVFQGFEFVVMNSAPWGNYGSGYYKGICVRKDLSP